MIRTLSLNPRLRGSTQDLCGNMGVLDVMIIENYVRSQTSIAYILLVTKAVGNAKVNAYVVE